MVDGKKEKEVFKPNINGSSEQRRMEAQKRKDLADGHVFATVNSITEMHALDKVKLQGYEGTVGDLIAMLLKDISIKNKTIELQKNAIISLDSRLKQIEKVVKTYGLE